MSYFFWKKEIANKLENFNITNLLLNYWIFSFKLDNFNPETLALDEFLLHVHIESSDKFIFFYLQPIDFWLFWASINPFRFLAGRTKLQFCHSVKSHKLASYPIKIVHREHAPDFKGVPIIRQLRVQARILQKESDLERPSTVEDISAQNRWIPWLVSMKTVFCSLCDGRE